MILNTLLNALLTRPRRAFPDAAVIIQQKKIPDVSFYQDVILWELMRQQKDAVIIRSSQGNWTDKQFVRNWQQAKEKGMLRGTYHLYDDRYSPQEQAKVWNDLLKNDKPEMEIWLDWENTYGGAYKGLKNVVEVMYIMETYGYKVGMYSGYYWIRANSNPITNAVQYNWLKTRPFWEAWYTNNASDVLVPAPWTSIYLWQFGTPSEGKIHGCATIEIDMSFINMTEAEFYQKYKPTTPPPPSGGTMYYEVRSTDPAKTRTVRTGPGIKYTGVSYIKAGGMAKANADNVFVYPNDVLDSSIPGGKSAWKGDTWVNVFEVDGVVQPAGRWVAKIHLGVTYTTLTQIGVPPTEIKPVKNTITMSDGSVWESTNITKL